MKLFLSWEVGNRYQPKQHILFIIDKIIKIIELITNQSITPETMSQGSTDKTHPVNGDNVAGKVTNNNYNGPVGATNSTFHHQSQAIGQKNQDPNKNDNEDENLQAVRDNTHWIQKNTKWVIVSTVVAIFIFGWGLFSAFGSHPTTTEQTSVESNKTLDDE